MTIFYCADDFESMMTCIYDAWDSGLGHEHVRLVKGMIEQMNFLDEYVFVKPDEEKVTKVVRSIQRKISNEVYVDVFYATLSYLPDALDAIYRYLILGFRYGKEVREMLQRSEVLRMMEIRRSTGNEAYSFREFCRFSSYNNQVYISIIEPKSNVLVLVAEHFLDRMPSENWILIDPNRRLCAVHEKNSPFYLRSLSQEELDSLLKLADRKDEFTHLWKAFFDTIAIKQRENRVCQMNHIPIWKRKNAVEFQME